MKTLAIGVAAVALVLGTGVAHADPPGTTSNDEYNAQIVCGALAANPSVGGLHWVEANMAQQGLSNDDVVDGIAYAVLYTCPEYGWVVHQAVG